MLAYRAWAEINLSSNIHTFSSSDQSVGQPGRITLWNFRTYRIFKINTMYNSNNKH